MYIFNNPYISGVWRFIRYNYVSLNHKIVSLYLYVMVFAPTCFSVKMTIVHIFCFQKCDIFLVSAATYLLNWSLAYCNIVFTKWPINFLNMSLIIFHSISCLYVRLHKSQKVKSFSRWRYAIFHNCFYL